ncbi:hypothetical protein [Puniceicoccus vermicola]|uniref:Uncharacterized protein n=2 Tax=Puniceicoccus vermicola TaxID=388746 RepID=A0A7X1AY59_9BACT|nr:hypothetical protein [Puniceicoccus vermicola]
MCGHRAHESNSQIRDVLIDYAAFGIVSIGMVASLWVKGNKSASYFLILFAEFLMLAQFSVFALIPYLFGVVGIVRK